MNEREREILRCLAQEWLDGDMRLPGNICYQDVIDFLAKNGVEDPGIGAYCENVQRGDKSLLINVFAKEAKESGEKPQDLNL